MPTISGRHPRRTWPLVFDFMSDKPRKPEPEAVKASFARLYDDPQPMHLTMNKASLWAMCSQLQLAFRHPSNTGPSRAHVEKMAETFVTPLIESDPELRLLWELGRSKACA